MYSEAGQLECAAQLVTDLAEQADRHGLDFWVLIGATERAVVDGLRSLARGDADAAELVTQFEMLDALIDTWRDLDVLILINVYEAVLRGC